jgi:hypothetical protein
VRATMVEAKQISKERNQWRRVPASPSRTDVTGKTWNAGDSGRFGGCDEFEESEDASAHPPDLWRTGCGRAACHRRARRAVNHGGAELGASKKK